jgi:hypothetical protein
MLPGYSHLEESKGDGFSFSMKIALCRALALCPDKLFSGANAVRKIRERIRSQFAEKGYALLGP